MPRLPVLAYLVLPLLGGCEILEGLTDNNDDSEPTNQAPTQFQTNAPSFNIDAFVTNLQTELDGDYAGVQAVVIQNGNLYASWADGNAIYSPNPEGDIGMTVDTRMTVASVSKFIGTIALMQVLEDQGIGVEQPIYNYLPDRWQAITHGDHFDGGSAYAIAFENLLRMETGLQFPSGTSWSPGRMSTAEEMQDALALPADPGRWGVYQNGNFTLIRVLMCEMALGVSATTPDYDQTCSDAYEDYINDNIFSPLGIEGIGHIAASGDPSRAHQFPFNPTFLDNNGNVGWNASDSFPNNAGSGGLYLSSMDLAAVVAFFTHDTEGTLLSEASRDVVFDGELGLTESTTGDHGVYYSKAGTRGPDDCCSRAYRARFMIYPNGVEAVVLTNSNAGSLGTVMREAFDDAW